MSVDMRLRELMKEKGLSAAALSKLSGIKETTIKSILSKQSNNPGYRTLDPIARVLNVSIDYLTEGRKAVTAPLTASNKHNVDLFKRCIDTIETLLQQKSVTLTYDRKKSILNELYKFSNERNSTEGSPLEIDKIFAEWLIEHF